MTSSHLDSLKKKYQDFEESPISSPINELYVTDLGSSVLLGIRKITNISIVSSLKLAAFPLGTLDNTNVPL